VRKPKTQEKRMEGKPTPRLTETVHGAG
jgi:hypothetical protein